MKKTSPLPGLEGEVFISGRLEPFANQARKQVRRQIQQIRLAQKIAGRSLELAKTREGLALVDSSTGECVDGDHGGNVRERFAALLMLAARDENHGAGIFDGNDGEAYKGSVSLWKPSLRIDPTWMETMRRRTRKEARARVEAMRESLQKFSTKEWFGYSKGFNWAYGDRFLTLTMPHHPGADTLSEVKRFNAAFRLLQKSDYWQDLDTWGGIKAIEDKLTADGPHVHGHFFMLSRKIDREALRNAWWSALKTATRKIYGRQATLSAEPILPDVRAIRPKVRRDGEIAESDALDEVCKYMTKVDELLEGGFDRAGKHHQGPGVDALVGLCMVKRWPRMVEMLGRARRPSRGRKAAPAPLDTSCISVPRKVEPPPLWNEEPMEPEERADYLLKIRAANAYLAPKKRARPPSWRDLIPETTLSEWLQIMAARVSSGIHYRLSWLRDHNPGLLLVTLDGSVHFSDPWPSFENA